MQAAYRVPDRPTSPPEPTTSDILAAHETRENRRIRHQWHVAQLLRCLARGLSVRIDGCSMEEGSYVPDACDYSDTDEAAYRLMQKAAYSTDMADLGRSYVELLDMQLTHAADDMMQAEARGGRVEYGVVQ